MCYINIIFDKVVRQVDERSTRRGVKQRDGNGRGSVREDCRTPNPVLRLGSICVNRNRVGVGERMRLKAASELDRESRGPEGDDRVVC